MDLPLAQDSIPHLPGRADGEQGAKKPESHSRAKNCSQIPFCFQIPSLKDKILNTIPLQICLASKAIEIPAALSVLF